MIEKHEFQIIAETKSERVNEQHARKKCIEIFIYLGYAFHGHVTLFVKCFLWNAFVKCFCVMLSKIAITFLFVDQSSPNLDNGKWNNLNYHLGLLGFLGINYQAFFPGPLGFRVRVRVRVRDRVRFSIQNVQNDGVLRVSLRRVSVSARAR